MKQKHPQADTQAFTTSEEIHMQIMKSPEFGHFPGFCVQLRCQPRDMNANSLLLDCSRAHGGVATSCGKGTEGWCLITFPGRPQPVW